MNKVPDFVKNTVIAATLGATALSAETDLHGNAVKNQEQALNNRDKVVVEIEQKQINLEALDTLGMIRATPERANDNRNNNLETVDSTLEEKIIQLKAFLKICDETIESSREKGDTSAVTTWAGIHAIAINELLKLEK